MNPDLVTQLARDAIEVTLYLTIPILAIGLVVGLLVSLFQAVTQIQEATLVFVPKIIVVLVSLLFLSPWMMQKMMHYTEQLIRQYSQIRSVRARGMQVDLLHWSLVQFQSFILIVMRVAPILFLMPVLSDRNVPSLAKIGLTLAVSLILLPLVKMEVRLFPQDPGSFGAFLAAELFIGFSLGLAVKAVFAGIQMGGELVGFQMGLSIAQVIDPESGMDSSAVAQLHYLLGIMIFLAVDGHHWFFRALVQSFHLLAPGEIHLRAGLFYDPGDLDREYVYHRDQVVRPGDGGSLL